MTRDELIAEWDDLLRDWPLTAGQLPDDLRGWYESYRGKGRGMPTLDAMPEPYVGPLGGEPDLIMLGLNPGPAEPVLQAKGAPFSENVRRTSYSAWAASDPYGSDLWETRNTVNPRGADGRRVNPYRRARLAFAREWNQRADVAGSDLLTMELYPWHSERVTSTLRPPDGVLDEWVWEPLSELPNRHVFAFGKPWIGAAKTLGVPLIAEWPAYAQHFRVDSRGMSAFQLPSGQQLVVIYQLGYAGPPAADDVKRMRLLLPS